MSGFARKVQREQMRQQGQFQAKHRAARYRRRGLQRVGGRAKYVSAK